MVIKRESGQFKGYQFIKCTAKVSEDVEGNPC